MKNHITSEWTIGQIIFKKGEQAGAMIDEVLCDKEKLCCPGTTHKLGYAANMKGVEDQLPGLLEKLNELPDLR